MEAMLYKAGDGPIAQCRSASADSNSRGSCVDQALKAKTAESSEIDLTQESMMGLGEIRVRRVVEHGQRCCVWFAKPGFSLGLEQVSRFEAIPKSDAACGLGFLKMPGSFSICNHLEL